MGGVAKFAREDFPATAITETAGRYSQNLCALCGFMHPNSRALMDIGLHTEREADIR